MKHFLETWFRSSLLPAALLGSFAFLLYINATGNTFVFDDLQQLAENPALSSQRWSDFFKQDVWAFLGGGEPQSNAYRPLPMVCYAALVRWVGHQPFYFHLLNIFLHVLNTLLVYALVRGLVPIESGLAPTPRTHANHGGKGLASSFGVAFIAAALFAAHPVHAQTVNFIGALGDLLCTFFVLIALLVEVQAGRGVWPYAPTSSYWLGPIALGGALLSKELALILPALLVALWAVYFGRSDTPASKIGAMSRRLAPYLVVIAAYVAVRMAVLGYFHKLNNQFSATFYEINLFRIRLAGAYLEKLIWPDGLSMYYAFRPTRSLLQPEVLISLVALVGLTVALWHWRRAPIPSGPLAWLGWLWTLLALLPLMNLRALGTHVFADWYLYLPSVGFVLIVAGILDSFPLRFKALPLKWRNGLVGVAVILLLGLFSTATVRQNAHWKDGYSLFSHGVKVSPNSAIHRANYAHQLVLRNRLDEAMAEDREAIRLAPLDFGLSPEAVFAPEADLGWMYLLRGETQAAEEHLRKATRIQPKNPVGHMRLGYVLEKGGQLAAALDAFGRAQELDPRNPFPHLARGKVFVKLRQDKDAIQEFQQAITLRPGTRAAYEGLIQALERQGRLDEARHWRAKLLELP